MNPPAVAWLRELGEAEVGLPSFVVMELVQGCRSMNEQRGLQKKLAPYRVLWPSRRDCDVWHCRYSPGLIWRGDWV